MMLKVGLIGCGNIAKGSHVPTYRSNPKARVTAICDIDPTKFDETEKKLGYPVKRYTDYKEMIAKEQLDFVDICTPNYLHADIAIHAMRQGLHVFSEKPDTVSVSKVLEMEQVQKETSRHLMVMRNNRYWYSTKQLKKMIAAGEFGDIYTGRCGWIRRRGIPGRGGWFTTKELSGGGPLIDLGVHMIDLAVYLMGNPKAVSVSGSTYNKFANDTLAQDSVHSTFGQADANGVFDVEDLATGFIKFDNGASLQLEFSWASNIEKEKSFVELRGSKLGTIWENGIYTLYDGKVSPKIKQWRSRLEQYKHSHDCHGANIQHFIDVLTEGVAPDYTIDQGVNMIRILCAIYESAATGKEVVLAEPVKLC